MAALVCLVETVAWLLLCLRFLRACPTGNLRSTLSATRNAGGVHTTGLEVEIANQPGSWDGNPLAIPMLVIRGKETSENGPFQLFEAHKAQNSKPSRRALHSKIQGF